MKPAGEVLEDTVVPACMPWSGKITKDDVLCLVDLEIQQAIEFLCYNADAREERYHALNTIEIPGQIYLGKGSSLWSVVARKMMTIIDDICGGHDTISGCCSFALDEVRYGATNPRCCQRNFEEDLTRRSLGPRDFVPNVNSFMRVPVAADGGAMIDDGISKPGDYVDLRADMDVLAVLSNCPEALNLATGTGPTPIRAIIYRPH